MIKWRRILHPTDFSRASSPAFAQAVALARAVRAELFLVHVLAPPMPIGGEGYVAPQVYEDLEASARKYAEKRLAWKRRHPLHVILLRTYRIPRPVTVKVRDEYGGCRSWLDLQRDLPFEGTPVLSDDEFDRAAEEIRSIVDDAQPALA